MPGNIYDERHEQLCVISVTAEMACVEVVAFYLDDKPGMAGGERLTRSRRDAEFWSSSLLDKITPALWDSAEGRLALTRYFMQDRYSNLPLLERLAVDVPDAIIEAVRHSRLVLRPGSERRNELTVLASKSPTLAEECRVLVILADEQRRVLADLEKCRAPLASLTPIELLAYASLHAFERLVPQMAVPSNEAGLDNHDLESAWHAIGAILAWKLGTAGESDLRLTEATLAQSLAMHLAPFLFPSRAGERLRHDLRAAFMQLLDAQIEVADYDSRIADAYSHDDAVRYVRKDKRLELVEHDHAVRHRWRRDGQRLARLHHYWLNRSMLDFLETGMADKALGRIENREGNQLAWIRARQTDMRLREVYGVGDMVSNEQGQQVPLFEALLSRGLTASFHITCMLNPFLEALESSGSFLQALGKIAFDGLADGTGNRFPLTWSRREARIQAMTPWTALTCPPAGSRALASNLLDFWTLDCVEYAGRLRKPGSNSQLELLERPFLRFGTMIVQLPWLTGMQNISSAAINNLRRLGQKRQEFRDETARIESNFATLFEQRGFRVLKNWNPPQPLDGEVDLICARDGLVLVIEVKSTYLRSSQAEAWAHATSTLRKAGRQLQRKIAAVQQALHSDDRFKSSLGVEQVDQLHGWIVDTSIESDHCRFSGFLKLSVEELLIALRDERQLLNSGHGDGADEDTCPAEITTLYPQGFDAQNLVTIIEQQAVWSAVDSGTH